MARKATKTKASRSTKTAASRKRATTASTRRKVGGSSTARRKRAGVVQRVKRAVGSAARRATGSSARARRHSSQTATRGQRGDAVAVLRADHVRLRQLLTRLHDADTSTQRERALEETRAEIERHTTIEEEIFYPAFRDAARSEHDREMFHEAHEEHNAAKMVLKELTISAEPEVFAARAKVLKDMIEHHAGEEETEMFPRAKQLLPREELLHLGQQLSERKRELARNSGGALQAVASLVRMPFSG